MPEPIDPDIRPTISGSSHRPDSVGVAFSTSCMYSGRVAMAPNMARPISTLTTRPWANIRLRNSRMGISASSFILISMKMNDTMPKTPSR